MHVTDVLVRFYKSFHFDYARKAHREAKPLPYEMIDDQWWPFIKVPLDRTMTAIVGANESGKSHLIGAIHQALTGVGGSRRDFCRYSALLSVERDRMRLPDVGVTVELDAEDAKAFRDAGHMIKARQALTFVRLGDGSDVFVDGQGNAEPVPAPAADVLRARLPVPVVLPADVPLPDSVTFDEILDRPIRWSHTRREQGALREVLDEVGEPTTDAVIAQAPEIAKTLRPYEPSNQRQSSIELARKLLFAVADVEPSVFEDLGAAYADGHEGQVGGLVESMNRTLAQRLNLPRWWRQDQDLQLRVSAHGDELVFTVRDRTGTEYSFGERSKGLQYFLGYFVQLLARTRLDGRSQILLMDEPDAYLSSIAQQDLLRVLAHFAAPEGRATEQVVYVTHSPFLVDRNSAGRIRVLDKGSDEEGTRVVNDAVKNHYEPLRSSIGSFVAETAFLGGTNLIVEGPSDQVLLSGTNALLRRSGGAPSTLLDLNETTIVPSGSASQVPYMAYLARGRDELKPACVVLLDGDPAGREARRQLMRSTDGRSKRVLAEQFIIDLAKWSEGQSLSVADGVTVRELEDLVPISVVVPAARRYAERFLRAEADIRERLTADSVAAALGDEDGSMFDALESAFRDVFESGIDKLGFAKELVIYVDEFEGKDGLEGIDDLRTNFGALLAHLSERLGEAAMKEKDRRTSKRTDEIVAAFLFDHQKASTRDEAAKVLLEVDRSLDGSRGDDAVAAEVQRLRREHRLDLAPLERVDDFTGLAERLRGLKVLRREAYLPGD